MHRSIMSRVRADATLDFLRWFSAGMVTVCHIRHFFFVDSMPSLSDGTGIGLIGTKIFYLATSLGSQAVVVFFVLSGYLIGGRLIAERGATPLADYFCRRTARIYVVLVPALALTVVCDVIGSRLNPQLYSSAWSINFDNVAANWNASTLLCNLANLQDQFCKPFGSNGPLWSLGYEWFYYLLFPLLLRSIPRHASPRHASVLHWTAWLMFLVALSLVFPDFCFFFPIWIMGAMAAVAFEKRLVPLWVSALGAAVMFSSIFLPPPRAEEAFYMSFVVGIGVALVFCNEYRFGLNRAAVHRRMASFSYSLYVTHHPVLALYLALLTWFGAVEAREQIDAVRLLIFAGGLMIAYAAAFVFSVFTERNTDNAYRWIKSKGLRPGDARY
jgi:peptidoglycan/LPS O-acetylase OafA/YrhL